MKSVIFAILFTILAADLAVAELTCFDNGEVIIYNRYADGVTVKVIPVGSIISGPGGYPCTGNGLDQKYSFATHLPNPRSSSNELDTYRRRHQNHEPYACTSSAIPLRHRLVCSI